MPITKNERTYLKGLITKLITANATLCNADTELGLYNQLGRFGAGTKGDADYQDVEQFAAQAKKDFDRASDTLDRYLEKLTATESIT